MGQIDPPLLNRWVKLTASTCAYWVKLTHYLLRRSTAEHRLTCYNMRAEMGILVQSS
jgi:hypothetical protein